MMFKNIFYRTEHYFYQRKIYSSEIRCLLSIQTIITGVALIVGFLTFWLTLWPAAFGIGSLLMLGSFWSIVHLNQSFVSKKLATKSNIEYFFLFLFRYSLIGAIVFFAIVVLKMPLAPLLVGLGSSIISIGCWGLFYYQAKPAKED